MLTVEFPGPPVSSGVRVSSVARRGQVSGGHRCERQNCPNPGDLCEESETN